jgi:pSer/pThr/pTyr-binding forkhead associated (FHA) protein
LKVQTPTGEWHVEFMIDPDGELGEGDILIDSELLLPAQPELGVGERTRRITTSHSTTPPEAPADERTVRTRPGAQTAPEVRVLEQAAVTPFATLTYEDQSGTHTFEITTDAVTIGRGGNSRNVDVKIVSSVDVSREHARIRRDAATGQFFLIDLSTLGTTLNNRHIPRGYDEADGVRRETGVETPLPDRARIGLAETVFVEFARFENPAKAGLHKQAG